MEKKEKDCNNNTSKTLIVLMSLCVALSLITLGVVLYDRFVRKEPEHVILKPIEIDESVYNGVTNNPDSINPSEDQDMIDEIIGDEELVEYYE